MSTPLQLRATLHLEAGRDVPVTILKLNATRAYVSGRVRAFPGCAVRLSVEDDFGLLEVPGELEWVHERSGVRLHCDHPSQERRIKRLVRCSQDVSGVVRIGDTRPETPVSKANRRF